MKDSEKNLTVLSQQVRRRLIHREISNEVILLTLSICLLQQNLDENEEFIGEGKETCRICLSEM